MKHKQAEFLIVSLALFFSVFIFGLSRQKVSASTDCDLDCLADKIAALTRRVAALEKAVGIGGAGAKKTTAAAKRATTSFLAISGGSGVGGDWTKVEGTDYWFDQNLYGNVTTVTWEGWVDNGQSQVRLYDATNNRGVDGSEVNVNSSGKASFYSQPLAIWRGQNKYYVQIKNINLVTVTISSPRLRIISK
ncbi:MAG: hypothetical protein AAB548_03330 [Patescibacteria group bacterium]